MKFSKKKMRIIIGCIGAIFILFIAYFAHALISLNAIGNTKIPNMTIELYNDSDKPINYSVLVEEQRPLNGHLEKYKKSKIKVVYGWNSSDKLQIKINDEDGNMICEAKPTLNIIPQHLYNPNIQYKLQVTFRNNELQVVQIE